MIIVFGLVFWMFARGNRFVFFVKENANATKLEEYEAILSCKKFQTLALKYNHVKLTGCIRGLLLIH